jgi:hypothetical protein
MNFCRTPMGNAVTAHLNHEKCCILEEVKKRHSDEYRCPKTHRSSTKNEGSFPRWIY